MCHATQLVYVDAIAEADTDVRTAPDLADRFGATLIGLCVLVLGGVTRDLHATS